jgi:hypothetical protein
LIEKHKSVFVKRALKGLQLLFKLQVLKDKKPLTLQVYYDVPRPKSLNVFGGTRRLAMQFLGQISGLNAHVILDIVATYCFVNSSYLDNSSYLCNVLRILVFCNWQMERKFKLQDM